MNQPLSTHFEGFVQPGKVLADKYVVERVLGVGGMGVVVAARHRHLNQRVAIKFLLPEVASNGEAVARFLREAQNATAIQSEHVARVSDVGTLPSGAPFMVMEYLEGSDLSSLLASRGPLPAAEAVDYVLQALAAIAEAHASGIVHRDLKPSNLFLTARSDGSALIKVLDFGISKATSPGAVTGSSSSLTRTAGMLGSPLYMAPEQIRSAKKVDRRADIWSLGVILYELVSGKTPFVGEELAGTLAAIVADPPLPLSSQTTGLQKGLERVVMRCLEKNPAARFASVSELALALAPFGSSEAPRLVQRVIGTSRHRSSEVALETVVMGPPTGTTVSLNVPAVSTGGTAGAWAQPMSIQPGRRFGRLGIAVSATLASSIVAGFGLFRALGGEPTPSAAPGREVSSSQTPPHALAAQPVSNAAPVAVVSSVVVSTPSRAAVPQPSAPSASARVATKPPRPAPTHSATPALRERPKQRLDVGDVIDERR